MAPPSLILQTTYAELLERCSAFATAFPTDGAFTRKTINGRNYWYFQSSAEGTRTQRYVGPETPELLKQIERHHEIRDDERECRSLVSTLIRSFGMPQPVPEIGNIVEVLAKAGVFRLRGVLIGTVAYQTYSAMLGNKLPISILQTGDVDIAQFRNVSVAVNDQTPPVLNVLKEADKTFRPVPSIHGEKVTSYEAKGGLRVDFLTPNEGPDTDTPQSLPAFQTDAQPLRFLDFLIHEPEPAVILFGPGIYVNVPTPQRYAIHKLIIANRRREGSAKRDKDIRQVEALIDLLSEKRPHELKTAWGEAFETRKWRRHLILGVSDLSPATRDRLLRIANQNRNLIPGIELIFDDPPPNYDFSREIITFVGKSKGETVSCAISREALDDHFGTDKLGQQGRLNAFRKNRTLIETIARIKYLSWPIQEPASVLIKTADMPDLLKASKKS
ncbi:MAG: DUF1488 family protein [Rhizobiales bacterium]|nr:DUF1488 family protein [Hyphomicrobiales bacterium]